MMASNSKVLSCFTVGFRERCLHFLCVFICGNIWWHSCWCCFGGFLGEGQFFDVENVLFMGNSDR